MKKIIYSLLAVFFATAILAQKQANVPELKKFETNDLYESTVQLDLSGKWKGTEWQYDHSGTYVVSTYTYEFELFQQGNQIQGYSLIEDKNGNFSEMNLRGFVIGNKLHFEEHQINDEIMEIPYSVWCYTTGELDISIGNKGVLLSGNIDGYSSDNYRKCDGAFVKVERIIENETEESFTLNPDEKWKSASDLPNEPIAISTYPNPFIDKVIIEYTLTIMTKVKLEIFDLAGKKIETLVNQKQEVGTHKLEFQSDNNEKSSGVYLVKLRAGKETFTKQFVQSK
ncbi:MAG: hypothetical protein COA57_08785 [Flavobacteriales bacterium]|nr:T9SS type A sorting domain-containing protein [Bacteroidales bacterium AH-315-I05]PCJ84667.1 MAG: hypothetical protein COA57_08785 [Flavobacteriales bacterium]